MDDGAGGSLRRRHARLKSLFQAALSYGSGRRTEYLARLRSAGPSVAQDVAQLLQRHAEAGDLLEPDGPDDSQTFAPNQLVAGRFRVVRRIGRGGMGEVYEAIDLELRQPVALKTIRPEFASDAATRARFLREIEIARRIAHPNVCRTHELWRVEDGAPEGAVFLTMELLEGEPLADVLKRGGRLDPRQALAILEQLAAALAAIHDLNIIHRDLKPSNVHIVPGGDQGARVVVTDFGLARRAPLADGVTATQALAGTPAYMAPEQFDSNEYSIATDVYAFGVICFEMLTGQRQPLVPARSIVPDLDPRWEQFILRCVAQDPRRRPANAQALLAELRALGATGWPRWTVRAALGVPIAAIAAGTVVTAMVLTGGVQPAVQSPEFTRLTFDPGLSCELSASADGRRIVYSSDRSGDGLFQLWIQDVPDGDRHHLATPGHAVNPAMSPDGQLVAFRSERDGGGIDVIPAAGGTARRVAPFGRHPRFSPDGSWIVYWTGVEGDHALPSGRIWIVPTAGGTPRRLHPRLVDARFPAWSPDGRRIVFRASATPGARWDDESDWWVSDADGRQATPTGAFRHLASQRLSLHDGGIAWQQGRLVFSARAGHSTNLWSLPVSPEGAVTGTPRRITSGSNLETSPWPMGDGFLAYTNWEVSAQVWRIWTGGPQAGTVEALTATDALDTRPAISADGTRLMFTRRLGEVRNLWIKDLPAGKETLMLPGTPLVPTLSPDGRHVAYSMSANGRKPIFVTRAPAGTSVALCDDCGEVQGWSGDGSEVLYLDHDAAGVQRLWAIGVPTGQKRLLVRAEGLSEGSLSPDGAFVAFAVRTNGVRSQIHVAPARAGTEIERGAWRAVTAVDDWADKPRWAPDGTSLYFYSERDGYGCLWRQALDEGTPVGPPAPARHLHEAQHAVFHLSRQAFALSVGPSFLVYNTPSVKGNLWMMDHAEPVDSAFGWLTRWWRGPASTAPPAAPGASRAPGTTP